MDRVMARVNESFSIVERLYEAGQMLATNGIPRLKEMFTNQTIELKILQVSFHYVYLQSLFCY